MLYPGLTNQSSFSGHLTETRAGIQYFKGWKLWKYDAWEGPGLQWERITCPKCRFLDFVPDLLNQNLGSSIVEIVLWTQTPDDFYVPKNPNISTLSIPGGLKSGVESYIFQLCLPFHWFLAVNHHSLLISLSSQNRRDKNHTLSFHPKHYLQRLLCLSFF